MQWPLDLKLFPGGHLFPPAPSQPFSEGLIFQHSLPPRKAISPDPGYSGPLFSHQTPTLCQVLGIQK